MFRNSYTPESSVSELRRAWSITASAVETRTSQLCWRANCRRCSCFSTSRHRAARRAPPRSPELRDRHQRWPRLELRHGRAATGFPCRQVVEDLNGRGPVRILDLAERQDAGIEALDSRRHLRVLDFPSPREIGRVRSTVTSGDTGPIISNHHCRIERIRVGDLTEEAHRSRRPSRSHCSSKRS